MMSDFRIGRRSFILGAASALALPAVLRAQEMPKISVGYTGINEYTGLFLAIEKGLFQKRNLNVEATLIPNNATIPAALYSGSIQVGTPSVTTLLQAVDGGMDLKIFCGGGVLSPSKPTLSLLVKAEGGPDKIADLASKRVGVPGLNALFHVIAVKWLTENGVDPKSVNFVETPFAQMYDLLRGGQLDAVVAAEPARGRILGDSIGRVLGNMLDAVPEGALSGNFSTTAAFADANPEALKLFREAVAEGDTLASANRDETLQIQSKYLKLSPDVLAKLPAPRLRAEIDPQQVEFWIQVAKDQNLIRRPIDVATLLVS